MAESEDPGTDPLILECEERIEKRLADVTAAAAEGRLYEAVKDTPSVAEQFRRIAERRRHET
ncbi:MAG TPA: hypothetical protein VFB78_09605 [Acidimicrobiales bacterium]|nr:hypothetical protein [Acidimicrobiales bacterium]